jgi:hypothetical protein
MTRGPASLETRRRTIGDKVKTDDLRADINYCRRDCDRTINETFCNQNEYFVKIVILPCVQLNIEADPGTDITDIPMHRNHGRLVSENTK